MRGNRSTEEAVTGPVSDRAGVPPAGVETQDAAKTARLCAACWPADQNRILVTAGRCEQCYGAPVALYLVTLEPSPQAGATSSGAGRPPVGSGRADFSDRVESASATSSPVGGVTKLQGGPAAIVPSEDPPICDDAHGGRQ